MTGTSLRKVDDLVKALGADTGICKSEVSRICADLYEQVASLADRDLSETTFPYVFLDASYRKARVGGARNGKGSRIVPSGRGSHRRHLRWPPRGARVRGR